MKTILFFLLLSTSVFSQSFVKKNDGTRIAVPEGSITVEPINKRIVYKIGQVRHKVKYKDLSHAAFDGYLFRTFTEKNKVKGYFVLAESGTKILAAIGIVKSKHTGGFETKFMRYQVEVLQSNGALIESVIFSDDRKEKNMLLRADAAAMIRSHFADCSALMQRLEAFEMTDTETQNNGIAKFIDSKVYTDCR